MLRITLLLTSFLVTGQAAAFSHWNDVRNSAPLPDGSVTIRTEDVQGAGILNTILYAENGVQEAPLAAVADGPSTLEGTVPGPDQARRYYGFRLEQPGALDLLPVRLAGGAAPARADLTRLAADPTGDEIFGFANLDLTECRISRDDTRLYASLTNVGGGFPVSSGLTFFSYLLGINQPGVTDPDTVFALIHTITAAGIIEPGLYQINGTGVSDLEKIGEITATEYPGENTLVLSCEWADLEANPVFQSWFDAADPRLDVAGFTQKITILGGAQDADSTEGGTWHLREVGIDPGPGQDPQLTGLVIPEAGSGGFVTVVYSDVDGHCPVIAELDIDGTVYPLRPQTLDYAAPVVYRSDPGLPPLESGDWTLAVARFSDNGADLVELADNAVGVGDGRVSLQMRAAPNPFTSRTEVAFALDRAESVDLTIYDVAGRRVATLAAGTLPAGRHVRAWNGRDAAGRLQPAGVYFYRLRSANHDAVQRLMLLR